MLAGDSAHQTPPFLGQGMCAALRDVSNLAWKLEAVLRSRASEALLDTYESERSPHVHAFIELAVRLGDIIQATDPDKARERDAKFKAGAPEIFEFPSPRLGPGVLHGDAAPVGQPFPQPVLGDGQLLDAHIGNRFAVIGQPAVVHGVSDATRKLWQQNDVAVMATSEPALLEWLQRHDAGAIMLRPDRYILGLARKPGELDTVTACLSVVFFFFY